MDSFRDPNIRPVFIFSSDRRSRRTINMEPSLSERKRLRRAPIVNLRSRENGNARRILRVGLSNVRSNPTKILKLWIEIVRKGSGKTVGTFLCPKKQEKRAFRANLNMIYVILFDTFAKSLKVSLVNLYIC